MNYQNGPNYGPLPNGMLSYIRNKVAHTAFESLGDSNQGIQGDVFLSAFDFPDVFVT